MDRPINPGHDGVSGGGRPARLDGPVDPGHDSRGSMRFHGMIPAVLPRRDPRRASLVIARLDRAIHRQAARRCSATGQM
jgi:hypothetical protein